MKLTNEQIKSIAVGAVCCLEEEKGLLFTKYTPRQLSVWQEEAPELVDNVTASTGIRLDFHTDSEFVIFQVSGGKKYELRIDGALTHRFLLEESQVENDFRVQLGKPGEMKHLVFSLPSHLPPARICGVTLEDGAHLQPHKFDRKLLFLGDSITQGWNSAFDTLSYAYQVSDALNAESVIHGIGGSFYEPAALADLQWSGDTVVVALGTNDFDRFDTLEEIATRARNYLQTVKTRFAPAKIHVITPIWRQDWQKPKTCGSFAQCRETIRLAAEELGLQVIDGWELMPHFPEFMADPVHPNDLGFAQYAKNLLKYLR